jgi:hypothetical protein
MKRETIHALHFIPYVFSDAEAEIIVTEAKTVDEIPEKLTSGTSNPNPPTFHSSLQVRKKCRPLWI